MAATPISRRQALSTLAAGALGTFFLPRGLRAAPSDQLRLAFVGVGGWGISSIRSLVAQHYVAFCDVDEARAAASFAAHPTVPRYRDVRQLLDRHVHEIDGVVITTPDHSHYPLAMACMEAGMNVYLEKPMATQQIHAAAMGEAVLGVPSARRPRSAASALAQRLEGQSTTLSAPHHRGDPVSRQRQHGLRGQRRDDLPARHHAREPPAEDFSGKSRTRGAGQPTGGEVPRVEGGHFANWFVSIRTRDQAVADFTYGAALTEQVLLGALAQRTGETIRWDAATMTAIDAPEATALARPEGRDDAWQPGPDLAAVLPE